MKTKKFLERCKVSGVNPNVLNKFVLIHRYLETGHFSIVCFGDTEDFLLEIMEQQPHFGSNRHYYFIMCNFLPNRFLQNIKDFNLINICKNVAEYLAVGEYAMLKKSYFKSSAWFEKAKNSASLGAVIIDNY